jgi:CBS domain-containing protein
MERLRDILQERELFWVEMGQSVSEVAATMAGLRVGAILVLEDGNLRGIFSERDLMTRVVVPDVDPHKTRVADVMTTDLTTATEMVTIDEAMELMRACNCRHLPVMRGSQVLGLVSMRDLMNIELERKTDEIQHMRAYIQGSS